MAYRTGKIANLKRCWTAAAVLFRLVQVNQVCFRMWQHVRVLDWS